MGILKKGKTCKLFDKMLHVQNVNENTTNVFVSVVSPNGRVTCLFFLLHEFHFYFTEMQIMLLETLREM